MKLDIHSADELGLILRAVRKNSRVPLEDLAQTVGVSRQTATNVEQGRAKVGTMLDFLGELGIVLSVDVPQGALAHIDRLRQQVADRASEAQAPAVPPDTE